MRWTNFRSFIFLQPSIYEELPETVSSIFQVEQEEAVEWRAIEEDSKAIKSQEILDIVPPEDSGKPADTVLPTSDAKPTRRPTLDVSKQNALRTL